MKRLSSGILVLATAACGTPPERPDPGTGSTCPPVQSLTYANFGEPFFTTYCTSCQETVVGTQRLGAPTSVNFDTVEQIRAERKHRPVRGRRPEACVQ